MDTEEKEYTDELKKLEQDKIELEKKTADYANSFAEEIAAVQSPIPSFGGEVVVKKETVKDKGKNVISRLKTVLGWN